MHYIKLSTIAALGTLASPSGSTAFAQEHRLISKKNSTPQVRINATRGSFKNPIPFDPPSKNPDSKNPLPFDPPSKNPKFKVNVRVSGHSPLSRSSKYAIKCLQLFASRVSPRGIEKLKPQEVKSAEWCLKTFARELRR